jgi:predicted O-methyltransferase YrrM
MKTVRPREIFNLLPRVPKMDRLIQVPMPHGPYGDEVRMGINLLETFLLIALAKHSKAEEIFEFGTHQGDTAQALALNLPNCRVVTIDRDRGDPGFRDNIVHIVGDSTELKLPKFYKAIFQLVFIDGGHEPATLENDTRLAYELRAPQGLIVWHDCGNPAFPHIETYLEDRAVRINETMLAVEGLLL